MARIATIIGIGLPLAMLCCPLTPGLAGRSGKDLFQSNRCNVCHKVEASGSFPSLTEIAQAYEGKTGQLIDYLQGKAGPIMGLEKARLMKRYLEKTTAMSPEDRQALAHFIMERQ